MQQNEKKIIKQLIHWNVTDPPDYIDTQLVCDPSSIPTPPAQSKFIKISQAIPMCANYTTKYTCNAGGLNVFQVLCYFMTQILTDFGLVTKNILKCINLQSIVGPYRRIVLITIHKNSPRATTCLAAG